MKNSNTHKKVLLVGWDAADWKVISPLIDAGKMPNLKRLIDDGVMGNLATIQPVLSPMLWTSIATGKRSFKHGINGFTEPDPATGKVRPVTNLSRKTKALWNILNQNELRSLVVGWWPSHPAEPIDGVMVSNHFHQAPHLTNPKWPWQKGTSQPAELRSALEGLRIHPTEFEGNMLLPFVPSAAEIDQEEDPRLSKIAKILAECSTIQAAATHLMQSDPWDFCAVYFDAIDHFSHLCMRYHPPRQEWVDEKDFERYQHVVSGAYIYHDMMLGALLHLAGEDATVIVMSDHGFHPDHLRPQHIPNEPAGPAAEHRAYGIIVASGPGIRKDELIFGSTLLDICPTVLSMFGLPIGRDMDGRPLTDLFAETPALDFIDSWDDVPGRDGCHPPDTRMDPEEAQELLKQLADLGYIDELNEDAQQATDETVRELKYNLARSYADAARLHDAIPLFDELWEAWPDEGRFGVQLFHAQLLVRDLNAARTTLERLQSRKVETSKRAREKLVAFSEQREGSDPADLTPKEQQKLRRLHAKASTNAHTLAFLAGSLLHAEGRNREALDAFRSAETVQSHNRPSLWQKIAEAHIALREWEGAEARLKQIVDVDPINPDPYTGLARVQIATGRFEEAMGSARAAIGLRFHNPQAHYLAGTACARLDRLSDAVAHLESAVEQHPQFPQAHRALARFYRTRVLDPEKSAHHQEMARTSRRHLRAWRSGLGSPSRIEKAEVQRGNGALVFPSTDRAVALPALTDEIAVVSGLPRSGTSLLMQMLHAGGVPVLTDSEREADENNALGYFEYEPVKRLATDASWLPQARGKAVKIVAPLIPRVPEKSHRYRILLMQRPIEEIVASQARMLESLGKEGSALDRGAMADALRDQLRRVHSHLLRLIENRTADVLPLHYHELLNAPAANAKRINGFLGDGLDEQAMAAVVDPSLCRFGSS